MAPLSTQFKKKLKNLPNQLENKKQKKKIIKPRGFIWKTQIIKNCYKMIITVFITIINFSRNIIK